MKYTNLYIRTLLLGAMAIASTNGASAQDNGKQKTIDVTSVFKPVLRDAVKINFSAAPPLSDTAKPRLNYNIPTQNLYFTYQPVSLKPMALQVDSFKRWDNSHFVKLGFGNFQTPLVQAGFSFGDGAGTALTIMADHISSKGNIEYQDYSQTGIRLNGSARNKNNQEWTAGIRLNQDQYFRYGYVKPSVVDSDSLKARYQTIGAELGFRNLEPTTYGISYNPQLKFSSFRDNVDNGETNAYLNLPIQKGIGKTVGIDLSFTADLTRYKRDQLEVINNNLFYVTPSVLFRTPNVNLTAGIRPAWDNSEFSLLPNVMLEVGTDDKQIGFQAGWIGYYRKTTFESLANFNPWINRPDSLLNNRVREIYGGVKGSLGSHFSYGAKLGVMQLSNTPLFVNDTVDGKSFLYVNEMKMKALHLGGEVSYTRGEDFYFRAGLKLYRYTGLRNEDEAWGLVPAEVTGTFRWQIIKDLYLKSDLFMWEGPQYRKTDGSAGKLGGAFDLNAGLEFSISRSFNLWLQMNNILNNRYERWNQYEVYGFNILGGVVFRFSNK